MFGPLIYMFDRIVEKGDLEVIDSTGKSHRFGDGTGIHVAVSLADSAMERQLAFDPALMLGEGYLDNRIRLNDGTLYDLVDTLMKNDVPVAPGIAWVHEFMRWATRRFHQFNPTKRARRNASHHYDINGHIYDLFLDGDRQYSCAYFEPGNDDLDRAQRAKIRHIAAKLGLSSGQKILDIGSGWGGLALYLAEIAGADVTGITLSREQLDYARARAQSYSSGDRVQFRLQDYRRMHEKFDRIVSVGMFEHVGVNHYRTFFNQVSELLHDDGVALIHAIGRSDQPAWTNPFIEKYIFPGGYIPSLSEVLPAIERAGLYVTDIEILRLHYAETLRQWRERFAGSWHQASEILDERFCRMWEFYLAGSEGAFRYQRLMVFQIQLTKRIDTLPLTRDYIVAEEDRLRNREQAIANPPRLAGE